MVIKVKLKALKQVIHLIFFSHQKLDEIYLIYNLFYILVNELEIFKDCEISFIHVECLQINKSGIIHLDSDFIFSCEYCLSVI